MLWGGVVSHQLNPQAGEPPTVGCPRLLIQYIRSYPPYLEAVSSIRNPRTRHAVVTVDPLDTVLHYHEGLQLGNQCNFVIFLDKLGREV
jgi:hypothetical protein